MPEFKLPVGHVRDVLEAEFNSLGHDLDAQEQDVEKDAEQLAASRDRIKLTRERYEQVKLHLFGYRMAESEWIGEAYGRP